MVGTFHWNGLSHVGTLMENSAPSGTLMSKFHILFFLAALTQFEGMCGFRPISDIQGFLRAVPEFAEAIGQEAASAIMSCSGMVCDVCLPESPLFIVLANSCQFYVFPMYPNK